MSASKLARLAARAAHNWSHRIADPENTNMADGRGTPYVTQFGASASKIDQLTVAVLPTAPLIVAIPPSECLNRTYENENHNTPFEHWEVAPLQYMTMTVTEAKRGICYVQGNWEDSINALSPSGSGTQGDRSGTATPYSERDFNKPRVKMTLADYKAGKRPTSSSSKVPGISGHTSGGQSQNELHFSSASKDVPPAADTQKMIDQIIAKSVTTSQASRRPDFRPTKQTPDYLAFKPAPAPISVAAAEVKEDSVLHGVTKNSQSAPGSMKPKRPLENAETTPEKRMKLNSRPPTISTPQPSESNKTAEQRQYDLPSSSAAMKSLGVVTKPSLSISIDSKSPVASKISNSTPSTSKPKDQATNEPNNNSIDKATSPFPLPRILSPLAIAGFDSSDELMGSSNQEITPPKSSKSKSAGKSSTVKKQPIDSPPSSPAPIPEILSPDLPSWIEREMAREKGQAIAAKSSPLPTAALHGVEARHERSRKPDTPGVARKTVKAKQNSSNSKTMSSKTDDFRLDKQSIVVKLKYGKRNVKTIKDILKLRAVPTRDAAYAKDAVFISEPRSMPSNSFAPLSSTASKSDEKKRARPADDKYESLAKRAKVPSILDIPKSQTTIPQSHRSPDFSTSSSSQRGNASFGTPKKGDAMKSVNMRKVDSTDGTRPRTPQATISTPSVSTPASFDRPKASGTSPALPSIEKDKAHEAESKKLINLSQKYDNMGRELKRAGDALLKSGKDQPNPMPTISEADRKLGIVTHLEGLAAFMISFDKIDQHKALDRLRNNGEHWFGMANGLITFLDRYVSRYPELRALWCLLGAICREQAERFQLERLSEKPPTSTFCQEIKKNSRARMALLVNYAELQEVHHRVRFVATVEEATRLAVESLERFAREQDVKWVCRIDRDGK